MSYTIGLTCKNGEPYIGMMTRPHCTTNCSLHDFKNQPSIYEIPIFGDYTDLLKKYLTSKDGILGLRVLDGMKVKKSVKVLKSAISNLQRDENYDTFSDFEEADMFKSTPKHAINALTHLKEMAEECVDTTCTWNVKEN